MFKKVKFLFDKITRNLIDDSQRFRVQLIIISAFISFIAMIMTVVNFLTAIYPLMFSTLFFSIFSFLVFWVSKNTKYYVAALYFFGFLVVALFTFFLITGGTEGFSVFWICLLPAGAMLLFGKRGGIFFCTIMFCIIVFFLKTPLGASLLHVEYTSAFKLRFPIVYLAYMFVAFLFELVRQAAYNSLQGLKQKYETLYVSDALTGIYNRHGFNKIMDEVFHQKGQIALLIIDIDWFKIINDTYGHLAGDCILKEVASVISAVVGNSGYACRWGGEEFAVLKSEGMSYELAESLSEEIRKKLAENIFHIDTKTIQITVSIGFVYSVYCTNNKAADIVNLADTCLYEAKKNGRNRCVGQTLVC